MPQLLLLKLSHAGKMLMVEELVKSLPPAMKDGKEMVHFATPIAMMAITELVQSAGKDAQVASLILVLTASSPSHMEEVSVTHFGTRASASMITLRDVRNGEHSTTPNAEKASTMLLAASAHPTASMAKLILESHAKRRPMVEVPVNHSYVAVASKNLEHSAIHLANQAIMEMVQFAGKTALLESTLAVLFALILLINALHQLRVS